MKKDLVKKLSPRPEESPVRHEDSSSGETSSLVTPAGSSRLAVGPGGDADSGDLSRFAADVGDVGDPGDLLASVVSYIRQFLVCDQHQLTLLALWVLYTWCFYCFRTAAYLDVRSPAPQSGKTRCLEILLDLCCEPALIAGADSRTAIDRLLDDRRTCEHIADTGERATPYTFLFDDCHLALGLSERQPLLALLNSGTEELSPYASFRSNYVVFGPKAFAGAAPLPRSLAARCIPIVLRRKRPSDKVSRFTPRLDAAILHYRETFKDRFQRWAEANQEALEQASNDEPLDLPVGLSPAQQGCAEPLLHVADRLGGDWPEKARAAIISIFAIPHHDLGIQMLSDVRLCFLLKDNPPHLTTCDLLELLLDLERPWMTRWTSRSGRRLGPLLRPFGIVSCNVCGPEKISKGYKLVDFEDAWERYLPPLPANVCKKPSASLPFTDKPFEINESNVLTE